MLETALIFAAGFLTASVLTLMILPGVNSRAGRLARRRLAAQFPISIEELTAQMDYVRAERAVEIRKLERQLEREREAHARTRQTIGTDDATRLREARDTAAECERLIGENAALGAERDALEQERDEKRIAVASLETQLENARTSLAIAQRKTPDAAQAEETARENALLRERIEAVAADIVSRANAQEAPTPAA